MTVSSQEDNDLPAESDLRARLVALMGGRAAEELLFHEVTGGASNDFEKANQIATAMVTQLGHGPRPRSRGRTACPVADRCPSSSPGQRRPAVRRPGGRDARHPRDPRRRVARRVRTLLAHLPTLRRIAAYLVEHERVDGDTFEALFDGRVDHPQADGEWRPQTARPRDWAEILPFRERRAQAVADRRDETPIPTVPLAEPEPTPIPVPVAAVDAGADDAGGVTAAITSSIEAPPWRPWRPASRSCRPRMRSR